MANSQRTTQFSANFHHDVVNWDGYVALDGSSAIIAAAYDSDGNVVAGTTKLDDAATIDHTGTGVYEITLAGSYYRARSITAQITYNGAVGTGDAVIQGNSISPDVAEGSQKIVVVTRDDSHAAADLTDVGIWIHARLENRK